MPTKISVIEGDITTLEARITRGYRLPASWVIHTVGPVWKGGTRNEAALLADSGAIILVVQDEANKNLLGDRKQESQPATRGHGTLTLTERFVVPAGSKEIRLFIPLVPNGISHTSGELLIRYPVVLCQSTQAACDKLVADFNALNERMRNSFKKE